MLGSLALNVSTLAQRDIARFWSKVEVGHHKSRGCWPWTGTRQAKRGYGTLTLGDGRSLLAHRFAYAFFFGEAPADRSICHTCDFGPCCRPEHLFVGDNTDNVRDSILKGRRSRTLTTEAVAEIRRRASKHEVQHAIALDFGISQSRVSQIVNGVSCVTWDARRSGHSWAVGEAAGLAKLVESEVLEIRRRSKAGETQRALAGAFGVSQPTITCIVNYQTWRHLP